jgi:hypothetical protein
MDEWRDDVRIYIEAKAFIPKYRLSNMFRNTIKKQRKIYKKNLYSKLEKIPNWNLSYLNLYYVKQEIMAIDWQQDMCLKGGNEIIIMN